jgi:hypothetical protein
MRFRLITTLLGLALWATPGPVQLLPSPGPMGGSTQQRYIVRAPGGINVVQTVCSLISLINLIGCDLPIESLGDPLSQVFVISTSLKRLIRRSISMCVIPARFTNSERRSSRQRL